MKLINSINKWNILSLLLILSIGVGGVFISCEEKEDTIDEVVLHSFGPSGVHHGDTIKFIGLNLDKVNAIVLRPEIEITEFITHTSTLIELKIPKEAEAGTVFLKSSDGDIESKSPLSFEVPVTITSISGKVKPGELLTIKGDLLNWIESITFKDGIVVDEFETQTLTELTVIVPLEAQSGFLTFSSGGTDPLTFASESELTVTLPEVTSLSPEAIRHTDALTITGTDLDLVTSVIFNEGQTVASSEFTNHTSTEIVVDVPSQTTTGTITLTQASPVEVVTSQELSIILPVATSVSPSPAVPGTDVMTIIGTDLDLVAEIILPGAGSISTFDSQSETEIVFAIPGSATQGALNYVTIHGFEGPLEGALLKLPPTGGFPTLDYYIYNDGLQNGWEAYGGWGHVDQDYQSNENPANGDYAIKSVFSDPYGAIQINNTSGPDVFAGYNYLVFYVYVAGEESDIIAQIGDNGDYYPPHFTGDKYHQIVVPLADLAGSDNVNELRIKNNNSDAGTNNTTVYIDEIGLTVEEPLGLLPDLITVIFDDEVKSPFGFGGGWGGASTDTGNEEQSRGGSISVKSSYVGGWGGACQFGSWGNTPLSTAGMEYLSFSIYGDTGTDGNTIQLNIKETTDGTGAEASTQVTINAGKWTDYQIPLSDLGNPVSLGEISFQDTDWSGTVYIDHIGLQ